MAHTKSGGSTQLGRDSESKRLGVKIGDGQFARAGQIIVRQRGTKVQAGANVRRAGDDTLYAGVAGVVQFARRRSTSLRQPHARRTVVSVRQTDGKSGPAATKPLRKR